MSMRITIERAHEILDEWYNGKQIGNIVFNQGHNNPGIVALKEHVIKTQEMPENIFDLVSTAFAALECDKVEIFRNFSGKFDRVKVVRGLE